MRGIFLLGMLLLSPLSASADVLNVPSSYSTIQEAIDAASDLDQIMVDNGTYTEQLTINGKSLEIRGKGIGKTTIRSPSSLNTTFVAGDSFKCLIGVLNNANLTITGFNIDGNESGFNNNRFVGLGFRNSGGEIRFCRVKNFTDSPLSGDDHGVCVYVLNNNGINHDVIINSSDIHNYQMAGAVLSGPNQDSQIISSTFTGLGQTSINAQTGIQVSDGAQATIENCTVRNHCYTGLLWVASGILLADAGNVNVKNCQAIEDNQVGAFFKTSSGTFMNNVVTAGINAQGTNGQYFGVVIDDLCDRCPPPRVFAQHFSQNITASPTTVTLANNVLTADSTGTGLGIGAWAAAFDNVVVGILNCNISGWKWGIEAWSDGTALPDLYLNENTITGNTDYGLINYTAATVAAEFNNWGDATGPYHAGINPGGAGDSVSNGIDFEPWITGTETLSTDATFLSISKGGQINLSLDAGAANAGRYYLIAGSMSGWEPGINLPGGHVKLPVNWDTFSDYVLTRVNTSIFTDFLSTLDGNGQASARITVIPPLTPTKLGKIMTFAFYLDQSPIYDYVSNPIQIQFTP